MDRQEPQKKQAREEYAIILDFLPHGYPFDNRPSHKKTAVAQAIGKSRFLILELVPKAGVFLQPHDTVYIGDGKRDQVHHILGRLSVDKLTSTARSELDFVLKELIKENEVRFVHFFNTAQPLTTRMHALELVPGLGKKHMWEIIEKRKEKDFSGYKDLRDRVRFMPDPEKAILKRIVDELSGKEKHKIFVDAMNR